MIRESKGTLCVRVGRDYGRRPREPGNFCRRPILLPLLIILRTSSRATEVIAKAENLSADRQGSVRAMLRNVHSGPGAGLRDETHFVVTCFVYRAHPWSKKTVSTFS